MERERKVRIVIETDKQELLNQLKSVKDKSQKIVNSLRHSNEDKDNDLKKQRDLNEELNTLIQNLKLDAKKNITIQEDLVRLVQKLQIELIDLKMANELNINDDRANDDNLENLQRQSITITCQHEDDVNQCTYCESIFSANKLKYRCMHCCKIFCATCSSKTVNSGPNLRSHKVCDSCYTLLVYCS